MMGSLKSPLGLGVKLLSEDNKESLKAPNDKRGFPKKSFRPRCTMSVGK